MTPIKSAFSDVKSIGEREREREGWRKGDRRREEFT